MLRVVQDWRCLVGKQWSRHLQSALVLSMLGPWLDLFPLYHLQQKIEGAAEVVDSPKCCATMIRSWILTTPSPFMSISELAGTVFPKCRATRTISRIFTCPSRFTSPVASCSSIVTTTSCRLAGIDTPVIAASWKFSSFNCVCPAVFCCEHHRQKRSCAGDSVFAEPC